MAFLAPLSGAFLLVLLVATGAEPDFCTNGFRISNKYHACWKAATRESDFTGLNNKGKGTLTPGMLEDYATHMCADVKPVAMDCLRRELEGCTNVDKLVQTADESGGTCDGFKINSYFKLQIIDRLQSVPFNSRCLRLGPASDKCVKRARKNMMRQKNNGLDIEKFYKVADKMFNEIWDCHVSLFKSKSDVCENWQLPMLMIIQKSATPALFGMRLNNLQLAKLELVRTSPKKDKTTPKPPVEEEKPQTSFLLMRLIKDRQGARPGDIVIKMNSEGIQGTMDVVSALDSQRDMGASGELDAEAQRRKEVRDRIAQKKAYLLRGWVRD